MKVALKGRKQDKGKWNFLVMRPQGEVTNFSVSPLLLAVAILFALVFSAGAILVMNLYFSLYLDYQDVAESRREALAKLDQVESQYRYQISLTKDYAELLADLGPPEPGSGADRAAAEPEGGQPETSPPEVSPSGQEAPPAGLSSEEEAVDSEEDPLSAWAGLLPAVAERSEERLSVADFRVEGNRFSFQLINDASGNLARGRLLTLFLVETGGRRQVVPFPDFDPRSPQPDFESGPGYNIRSSKYISGQLRVPADCEILAAMVAAQSSDGRMVMKRMVQF